MLEKVLEYLGEKARAQAYLLKALNLLSSHFAALISDDFSNRPFGNDLD
jgi:hypothetical protein